jgi:hypothetical protein
MQDLGIDMDAYFKPLPKPKPKRLVFERRGELLKLFLLQLPLYLKAQTTFRTFSSIFCSIGGYNNGGKDMSDQNAN